MHCKGIKFALRNRLCVVSSTLLDSRTYQDFPTRNSCGVQTRLIKRIFTIVCGVIHFILTEILWIGVLIILLPWLDDPKTNRGLNFIKVHVKWYQSSISDQGVFVNFVSLIFVLPISGFVFLVTFKAFQP